MSNFDYAPFEELLIERKAIVDMIENLSPGEIEFILKSPLVQPRKKITGAILEMFLSKLITRNQLYIEFFSFSINTGRQNGNTEFMTDFIAKNLQNEIDEHRIVYAITNREMGKHVRDLLSKKGVNKPETVNTITPHQELAKMLDIRFSGKTKYLFIDNSVNRREAINLFESFRNKFGPDVFVIDGSYLV